MTDFRVHFDWNGNRHIVAIAADTPDAAASIITKRYPGAIVSKTKRDKSSGITHLLTTSELPSVSTPGNRRYMPVGDSRVRPNHQ